MGNRVCGVVLAPQPDVRLGRKEGSLPFLAMFTAGRRLAGWGSSGEGRREGGGEGGREGGMDGGETSVVIPAPQQTDS